MVSLLHYYDYVIARSKATKQSRSDTEIVSPAVRNYNVIWQSFRGAIRL